MDVVAIIIGLAILLFSAILHEIAHGAMAEYFGDGTAREAGRITLNPISHIDPWFTIVIPLVLFLSGSPVIFGAAKPVPVNYHRFTNYRWGVFWVSIAGILTNLAIAFAFSLPLRLGLGSDGVRTVFTEIVVINVVLAVVNMTPIPPIDGSKVLAALFGAPAIAWVTSFERRGWVGILPLIILIYVLFSTSAFQSILVPVVNFFLRIFGLGGL